MRIVSVVLLVPLLGTAPTPWLSDLDQAFALAKKTGQPIFVVLSCPH